MKRPLLFIPLVIFLAFVAFFAVQLMRNAQGEGPTKLESVLVGQPMPDFELNDLFNPQMQYDKSLFQGEPMLLNVWATWCPTCLAEHAYLNQLAGEGVKVIGLNYKDNREKAIQMLKTKGNPYQVTLSDPTGLLAIDLGVYGAPETYLIDANGMIRYRHVGEVNAKNWQEELLPRFQALLDEVQP
ncbi:Thiol:disulfide interchange protein DsbE [Vibrio stylophorae]|uniref:Thiol:disulfide interchange protein DsbE n=1 Tax=Vibrio stylophorae TaxID=659351 RepID=A0ABN8DSK3_9VIBR|nr:DsbE family thiol:disulfide interchange protein [Vibrio stylophorae]CAH0534076.1 Thiol:disulfide interchange protein DsbE [Vibrio stylophorae]